MEIKGMQKGQRYGCDIDVTGMGIHGEKEK
jgi:hypothetical protein